MEKMDYSEVSEAEEEQMDSTEEMPRKRELLQSALLSMEHNFAVTKQMLFKEKHQFYEKKLKELRGMKTFDRYRKKNLFFRFRAIFASKIDVFSLSLFASLFFAPAKAHYGLDSLPYSVSSSQGHLFYH